MDKMWYFLALLIALPPLFSSLPEHGQDDADERDYDIEGGQFLMRVWRVNSPAASLRALCELRTKQLI